MRGRGFWAVRAGVVAAAAVGDVSGGIAAIEGGGVGICV